VNRDERLGLTATGARPRARILPDLGALRHRDYRLLWGGMFAMSALMPLQFTAQVLYLQAAAPADVRLLLAGLLGATRGGAMLLLSLVGGALADRMDRRRLLLVTQSVAIAANGAVAALMLWSGGSVPALVAMLALTFVAGGAMAVDTPTRQALVPQLVPREHLVGAIALDAVAMQIAFPLSLPLAGLLIDRLGFGGAFACSLLGHAAVFAAVTRMRPPGRVGGAGPSLVRTVREGLAYTRRSPTVLWLILLLFAVMAIGFPPVASLGPVWVTQVLGLSPARFGLFAATWGLGAMLASMAMTTVGHFPRKGWLVTGGAVGFACWVVVWGYSRSVPLSALANFCLGGLLATTQISARSLVQRAVPNAVQGRVLSLFMLNMGVAQLMTAPIGALAQAFTLEVVVPILGWIALAVALGIGIVGADIRRAGHAPAAG
jgi:MFS family permease